MTPGVPLVAAALSAVLSSGLTAAYLRSTAPDTVPIEGAPAVVPETRPIATRLAEPAAPYRAPAPGGPVDFKRLDPEGTPPVGSVRGWQQLWESGADEVTTYVVEFGTAAQAQVYTQGGAGRLAGLLGSPEPFLVEGVPGAEGVSDTKRDSAGLYLHAVVMRRDRFTALLVFNNRSARPGNLVQDLVRRQWIALAP